MSISIEELKHIANLSNLYFSDEELQKYASNMSSVVEFANELSKIDTTGVEITNSILGEYNIFRKDEIKESFDRDLLLDNAPEQGDGMFKIPKVIG